MRDFEFEKSYRTLLVPEMISYLTLLHEYRGKQESMLRGHPEVLTRLVELAKIQSTDASNKIEGIYTSDERLKLLVREKTMPRTRDEKERVNHAEIRQFLTFIQEDRKLQNRTVNHAISELKYLLVSSGFEWDDLQVPHKSFSSPVS